MQYMLSFSLIGGTDLIAIDHNFLRKTIVSSSQPIKKLPCIRQQESLVWCEEQTACLLIVNYTDSV